MEFTALPGHLTQLAASVRRALEPLTAAEWSAPYQGSSGWTRVELLGHIVDSAINNHQRFVRALIEEELSFPGYAQEEMVRVQSYRSAEPAMLVDLWAALNLHIAHVLRQVPPDKLATLCRIGADPATPLAQLALDYSAHLEHHLRQLTGHAPLPYSGLPWPPVAA